jgi:hypothetical protein
MNFINNALIKLYVVNSLWITVVSIKVLQFLVQARQICRAELRSQDAIIEFRWT